VDLEDPKEFESGAEAKDVKSSMKNAVAMSLQLSTTITSLLAFTQTSALSVGFGGFRLPAMLENIANAFGSLAFFDVRCFSGRSFFASAASVAPLAHRSHHRWRATWQPSASRNCTRTTGSADTRRAPRPWYTLESLVAYSVSCASFCCSVC